MSLVLLDGGSGDQHPAARWLVDHRRPRITIVFCGSKEPRANGIPMANVLFPAAAVGAMVLPLMIFHRAADGVRCSRSAMRVKPPNSGPRRRRWWPVIDEA